MIRSVRSDIEIFAKENVFIKDEFYIAISGKKKEPLFCPMLTLNIKSTNLTANLCENIKIDLDVVMIIIDGAFSGIVQNWLMNMAGYDLYKQAPALVDNVLRMFMPDENITKLIRQTNELSVI